MEKESGLPRLPERKPRKPVVYPGMSFEEVLNTIEKECGGPLAVKSYGRGKHKVIILPEAVNEFRVMVSFGRRSPKNRKEQVTAISWTAETEMSLSSSLTLSRFLQ